MRRYTVYIVLHKRGWFYLLGFLRVHDIVNICMMVVLKMVLGEIHVMKEVGSGSSLSLS